MSETTVFGSQPGASTAAIAWWRWGSKRSPVAGLISRTLARSSATPSCFRVSSTPLRSASRLVFSLASAACRLSTTGRSCSAKRSAVDDRQELLGKALHSVFLYRRRLSLGALAGVFRVRHRAHQGVALLLQLGLCLGQQLLQRLVFALRLVRLRVLLLHRIELGMGPQAFKPGSAILAKPLNY